MSTLALLLVSLPLMASKYPDVTEEGLVRVKDSRMQAAYIKPNADLSGYTRIMLETPGVAFAKNWQRDQNRTRASQQVREEDMQKIRDSLAKLFDEVFTDELAKGGYELVTSPGDDVLQIRPKIVDLQVNAPDSTNRVGRITSYTESAGEMTLNLELFDSVSGELLAKGMDRRKDPLRGYAQLTTSVSNTQAARRILIQWAKTLREGLDELTTP